MVRRFFRRRRKVKVTPIPTHSDAPTPKVRRANPEHVQQKAFFNEIKKLFHPAVGLTFAVPNAAAGSKLSKIMFYIDEGMLPGCADVICLWPNAQSKSMLIMEFKSKGGRMRPNQIEFRDLCLKAGHTHLVVYTAREALEAWCRHVSIALA